MTKIPRRMGQCSQWLAFPEVPDWSTEILLVRKLCLRTVPCHCLSCLDSLELQFLFLQVIICSNYCQGHINQCCFDHKFSTCSSHSASQYFWLVRKTLGPYKDCLTIDFTDCQKLSVLDVMSGKNSFKHYPSFVKLVAFSIKLLTLIRMSFFSCKWIVI